MKLREILIAEQILEVIGEEIQKIKDLPDRDIGAIGRLEKLTKSYSVMMANAREMQKSGIYGSLSNEEIGTEDEGDIDAEDM